MFEEGNLIYKIILVSFIMPILLSIGLIWFFLTYQRKRHQHENEIKDAKIREQNLLIEKHQALESERTRIANEMHDGLGGGLTSIRFLSNGVLKEINDEKLKEKVSKIASQSVSLVNNMSEIIWAMNAGFDSLSNLIAYIRRYSFEFLEDFPVTLNFKVEGDTQNVPLSGKIRRNVFLIIKEALHNVVKHSKAEKIEIEIKLQSDTLQLSIHDNGVGIKNKKLHGNGLNNMKKRMVEINGVLEIDAQKGTKILLTTNLGDQEYRQTKS